VSTVALATLASQQGDNFICDDSQEITKIVSVANAAMLALRNLCCQKKECSYSRNARMGSVRAARHAGRRQAASEASVITSSAEPNDKGSRGLIL
jgi:hypothetical protein